MRLIIARSFILGSIFFSATALHAATITSGSFYSAITNDPTLAGFAPSLFFSNIVTNQFSFTMGYGGPAAPFVPVPLACGANGLQTPCTLTAGTTYSSTWSNNTNEGLTLNLGGNTYSYQYLTAQAWSLTLNFTPTSTKTFTYQGGSVVFLANVTGTFYATDSNGNVLLNNVPLVGLAHIEVAAGQGQTPGSTVVSLGGANVAVGVGLQSFFTTATATPEPEMSLLTLGGLMAIGFLRKLRL